MHSTISSLRIAYLLRCYVLAFMQSFCGQKLMILHLIFNFVYSFYSTNTRSPNFGYMSAYWMESIPEPSPGPMRSPAPSSRGNITLSIYLPAPEHWRQRQIHSLMAKNKLITAQQYRFLVSILSILYIVSILWLSFYNAEQKSFIPLLCLH